jgi:hypothetical protein
MEVSTVQPWTRPSTSLIFNFHNCLFSRANPSAGEVIRSQLEGMCGRAWLPERDAREKENYFHTPFPLQNPPPGAAMPDTPPPIKVSTPSPMSFDSGFDFLL